MFSTTRRTADYLQHKTKDTKIVHWIKETEVKTQIKTTVNLITGLLLNLIWKTNWPTNCCWEWWRSSRKFTTQITMLEVAFPKQRSVH